MTTTQHPGRWAMAVAKAHRAALIRAGVEEMPAQIDVTVSLMILHRNGGGVDWQRLLGLDDRDMIATVGTIHERINRKTGQVDDLLPITQGEAHA